MGALAMALQDDDTRPLRDIIAGEASFRVRDSGACCAAKHSFAPATVIAPQTWSCVVVVVVVVVVNG